MGALTERLEFLVKLDSAGAVKGFSDLGDAADKNLKKADTTLDRVGGNMVKFGAGAVAAATIVGAGLLKAGQSASDLSESLSKTNVIFGSASKGVIKFAEDAATNLGLSEVAALDAAAQFAQLGKAAGMSGNELAGFSTGLTTLAGDLASFNNSTPEEAVMALGAALRGEAEPIRKFGVLLDDATLKAAALKLGIYDGTGALTQQQKILAAHASILEQTSDAQGDFARTSDGAANSQRIMAAEMENAKASLGASLAPVIATASGLVADLAGGFTRLNEATDGAVGKFAGVATAAVGLVGAVSAVGGKLIQMRDRFTEVSETGTRSLTGLGKVATGLGVVGAAAGLLTIAYDAQETQQDRVTEASKRYTTALQAEAAGTKEAVRQQIAKDIASSGYLDTLHKVGLTEAEVADVIAGKTVPAYEKVKDRIAELVALPADQAVQRLNDEFGIGIGQASAFTDKTDVLTMALTKAKEGLALADATMKAVGDTTATTGGEVAEASSVMDELAVSADTATKSVKLQNDEMKLGGDRAIEFAHAQAQAKGAAWELEQATNANETATRALTTARTAEITALNIYKSTIDELYGRERSAIENQQQYEDDLIATKFAVDNYNATLKDTNSTQEQQASALKAARDQAIKASEDFATLNGASLNSEEGVKRQVESLYGLATSLDPNSKLRAELTAYINQLGRIPSNITTSISTTIKDIGKIGGRAFAGGTSSAPQGVALVGEEGPELVEFKGGERVRTATETAAMISGGGGTVVVKTGADPREVIRIVKQYVKNGGRL